MGAGRAVVGDVVGVSVVVRGGRWSGWVWGGVEWEGGGQEHQYLLQVLQQTGGQVRAAHQLMGISRKSLYEKINKYGIDLRPRRDKG